MQREKTVMIDRDSALYDGAVKKAKEEAIKAIGESDEFILFSYKEGKGKGCISQVGNHSGHIFIPMIVKFLEMIQTALDKGGD